MSAEIEKKAPKTLADYTREMKETVSILKWVWDELVSKEGKRLLLKMNGVLAIMTLLVAIQPLVFAWIIDALNNSQFKKLILTLVLLFSIGVIQRVVAVVHDLMREWILNQNTLQFQETINRLFCSKSLGQHLSESRMLSHVNMQKAHGRTHEVQNMLVFETGSMLFSLLFSCVLLWVISPVAGVSILLLLCVHTIWSLHLNYHTALETTPIEKEFRHQHRQYCERWEKIVRMDSGGKTHSEHRRLMSWLEDILKKDRVFWFWYIKQSSLRDILALAVKTAVLCYGCYLVYNDMKTVGFLVPLYTWTTDACQKLWYIGHAERRLSNHIPHIRAMKEALELPPAFDKTLGIPITEDVPISVRFEDVGLTYKDTTKVLENINFRINPGEKVALIGASGAGKTSIMRLLLRFMDPSNGTVWVNGYKLQDVYLSSWMEHVGYIPQQPQILDGTIRYNLTFGLPEDRQKSITDEEIWEVMRLLQIDFGERLTDGLDTRVGRDGIELSGGQAQRLMIGAAVIKRPIFMVIDEATSSLDSSTEMLVQKGLETALSGSVGALIVAHRLSTVRNICNRFIVLRPLGGTEETESQIEAEADSFEQLYELSPTFRELVRDQGIVL